jgi:NAD(P)-dependent dehydrogenase (short-subunit alcohol dehydrogenase family)
MTTLIYGGTSGIGLALAQKLHAKGQAVHLVSRHQNSHGFAQTLGDVLEPETFARATNDVGESLTHLVYAVGSINLKPFHRLQANDYTQDFKLNALGAALAVQAALSPLKANQGSVVFFSSIAVRQGFTAHAAIAMAKGAVEGLTLSLAAELAPKIRVNCIAPSLTKTPLAQSLTSNDAMASAIATLHPLQRLGEAEDSAGLAAFLLSPEASWITGQVIGVDGGRSTLRTKG